MDLPDYLLLTRIESKCAYLDKKSVEARTKVKKPKYKLASNSLPRLGVHTFFVMMGKPYACEGKLTLHIKENEWLEKDTKFKGDSYIDIKNIEAMNDQEILQKSRDSHNGLTRVARMPDSHYKKLRNLVTKVHTSQSHIPQDRQQLIRQAVSDTGISDKIIKNLGLG